MEKVKLSEETVLKLQYAIVAASVYPYYLKLHEFVGIQDVEKAADDTHYAAIALVLKLNTDIKSYVKDFDLEQED